jgi:hypothetical protein
MAELEADARAGRQQADRAAPGVKSQQVAIRVEDISYCLHVGVHEPDAGYQVGPQRIARDRARNGDDDVAGQRGHVALRDEPPDAALEEMGRVLQVAFDPDEPVGEDGRGDAEGRLDCAGRLQRRFRIDDVRVAREFGADEGDEEEVGLRVRVGRREKQ